jgi:hypothetical protein
MRETEPNEQRLVESQYFKSETQNMNDDRSKQIAEVEGEIRDVKIEERDIERLERSVEAREAVLEGELAELKARISYTIVVNRAEFHHQPQFITGSHILDLASQNDGKHGVALLRGGGEHDVPVEPNERVDIEDPKNRRFKTFPVKSTEGR